ncbi:head completion protein [uncultured Caudovirales phage]|uniref:Head completion nuclease n=1 Tax=uncultured Caudovirales phage TaxID=2100421 RepID=A0A6J5LHK2_9CAUD|nr:head completion protein [uncultured Caudovirales phage]
MAKYANGFYQLLNPTKYVGTKDPHFRSSWEHTFMRFCDENPAVLQWANEAVHIPYRNPFTNKQTIYVPDFLIMYVDKNGTKFGELIEIKPTKETSLQEAGRSMRAQAAAVLNMAKWEAARAWCKQNSLRFRVVTEHDIFHQGRAR